MSDGATEQSKIQLCNSQISSIPSQLNVFAISLCAQVVRTVNKLTTICFLRHSVCTLDIKQQRSRSALLCQQAGTSGFGLHIALLYEKALLLRLITITTPFT